VMRGGCHALTGLPGERLDRSGPLRQEVKELETTRACCGLADPGDLLVDRRFKTRWVGLVGPNSNIQKYI
jgi:hypothetical protein